MTSLLGAMGGSILSTRQSSPAMNTVLEADNEDLGGSSSHEDGDKASTSGASTTEGGGAGQSTSSSSFSLARAETLLIKYSKVVLLIVIALVAVAMTICTYLIVKGQERKQYEIRVSTHGRKEWSSSPPPTHTRSLTCYLSAIFAC